MSKVSLSESIKDEIRSVFCGVVLGRGISLEQTKVIDRYGEGCSDEDFAKLPSKEVTGDWSKIPSQTLDEAECLAFLDAEGLRYYLPALMFRLIEDYDSGSMRTIGTISALDGRNSYNLDRYSLLDDRKKAVIAHFIEILPRLVELDPTDRSILERSLSQYWEEHLQRRDGGTDEV